MRVVIVVEIPDEVVSVKSIEEAVSRAGREFPSLAWQAAVAEVEGRAMCQHPEGSLTVCGWEERTLWTTSGPVRFKRRRFRSSSEERSFLIFDLRAGLRSRQRTTEAADQLLAQTAAECPFAVAARFCGRVWGEAPSPMLVWHAVQRIGGRMQAGQDRLRRSVFEDGELPGWERPAPEFVGVEADSTFLGAWRGRGSAPEVYVGLSYTGKEERHGRRRLRDKALCFGLAGSGRFGRDFFVTVQARHNVVEAASGVFLSDGAEALRNIQREHFPRHVRQLDWAHLRRRMDEAYGPARRERSAELLGKLYAGEREAVCREVRGEARRYRSRSEVLNELAGYLDGPGRDLYGSRRLRRSGAELPPHLNGSGGIERNIGVLVGQRMKRRGMSWTRRGAANLLAVRQDLLARLNAS